VYFDPRWFLVFAVGLIFISWMLPGHYYPWPTAHQDFLCFVAVLCLMPVLFVGRCFRVPRGAVLFLFLISVPLFQYLFGVVYFFGDALVSAAYLAAFTFSFIVMYNISSNIVLRDFFLRVFAWALVVCSVLSVYIALRQWLLLPGNIWVDDVRLGGRPFANLAQPNNLATLLCMGLFSVLFIYEKYYIGRLAGVFLSFFILLGIALTQSRTPWVGAFVLSGYWAWKSFSCRLRLPVMIFIGWVLVYVVFIFSLPLLAELLLLGGSGPLDRAQSFERWNMWIQFWHAIWLGPLWGFGWSQVSVAQVAVSLAYPVPIFAEHSHNIILDILLWNGPVLGGFVVCAISLWLLRFACLARSSEALFSMLAVGFVLVHAMLEFPLEYAFFLVPVGLLLGVVASELSVRGDLFVSRKVVVAILILAVPCLSWVGFEYRVVEEDHRLMRFESSNIGSLKANHAAPDVMLLTQLREFIRLARTPDAVKFTYEELDGMRKAAHRYPYVSSLSRYALALAFNERPEAASRQLLILRAMHGENIYAEIRSSLQEISVRYPELIPVLQGLPDSVSVE
jgi:hypothetical protein